jgi:hypothetical protein
MAFQLYAFSGYENPGIPYGHVGIFFKITLSLPLSGCQANNSKSIIFKNNYLKDL